MYLRDVRKKSKMSQAALSAAAGVSRQTISYIETGHVPLTVKTAKKLAAVLGVDFRDLLV